MYRGSPGAFPNFPEIGKILGKPFAGGVWGETGSPKGLPDTIQSIWVAGNPLISNLKSIPPQNHVFQAPLSGSKTWAGPRKSGPGPGI